jgi:hypothetical protein
MIFIVVTDRNIAEAKLGQIDHIFLSGCSHEDWLKHQHTVITSDFVPLTIRTELFVEVYKTLLTMKARVWITGGTLLGAVREGDFIIDDDDVDMDMIEDEFLAIMYDIKATFMKAGYVVRLKDGKNPKISVYKSGFKLSIGALKPAGKWLTRPIQKYPSRLFSEEHFMTFKGVRCLVPFPPEEYLEHVYGLNWTVPITSDNDDITDYHSIKSFNFRSKSSFFMASKIILKRLIKVLV